MLSHLSVEATTTANLCFSVLTTPEPAPLEKKHNSSPK